MERGRQAGGTPGPGGGRGWTARNVGVEVRTVRQRQDARTFHIPTPFKDMRKRAPFEVAFTLSAYKSDSDNLSKKKTEHFLYFPSRS